MVRNRYSIKHLLSDPVSRDGCIYLVSSTGDRHKIGVTSDMQRRLYCLKVYRRCEVVHTVDTTMSAAWCIEHVLHLSFMMYHIGHEWYKFGNYKETVIKMFSEKENLLKYSMRLSKLGYQGYSLYIARKNVKEGRVNPCEYFVPIEH